MIGKIVFKNGVGTIQHLQNKKMNLRTDFTLFIIINPKLIID
jgi:hypothetical protein